MCDRIQITVPGAAAVCKTFTEEELKTAFDMVVNPLDWKGAIDAEVSANGITLAMAAITRYTAAESHVIPGRLTGYWRIQSEGYRAGRAANR